MNFLELIEVGALNKVPLTLVGLDGNVFNLIAEFKNAARKAGWDRDTITEASNKMLHAGSYDEVINLLTELCEDEDSFEEDEDYIPEGYLSEEEDDDF